ncbi:ATP-dependent helicase HrpB [Magnetospirillum molischianum]|uniref:ATP-dependent helicase n=1 Tax=Magnetospirillum molischianum DSM 120 TaxID=1150626 RepID=H8FWY2_MAGML|nr:ATP-dependent helicase HrpB [Magnetospirillum molischianum]CCG42870.1 ATP-dependent helicase [Magnetospirillum molischianum DSM 120]
MQRSPLPIDGVLCALRATLASAPGLVLLAPPGAGKTTRVPLALLDEPWLAGQRIVMLEPRRLAARAAARRMAAERGETPGQTVGWRVRFDSKVGPETRIEVVTEGILTRMLQDDPSLPGVGLVIFDEFHERSLHADLGLALALEAQQGLRDDLKLMVMSATLEGGPVAQLMGGVPVIESPGRAFPVETRFLTRPEPRRFIDEAVRAVTLALDETEGDVLVFLPGAGEIRRVESRLAEHPAAAGVTVAPLYGDLATERQDVAIAPSPEGHRKVVLATAIAETSLTIEGVRTVVDCGQSRVARFDPGTGMTRLVTQAVSRSGADQRRGRAGRLGPGVCYRLWSEAEDRALAPSPTPEIMAADLAPLALDLARWGVADIASLAWINPPPEAHLAAARDVLTRLGAVDSTGRITAHGRAMARLPLHPRLAHMMLKAQDLRLAGLACDLAALLEERDMLRAGRDGRDADLRLRLQILRGGETPDPRHGLVLDRGILSRVRQAARDARRRLGLRGDEQAGHESDAGLLLAFAYPDRIARRRPGGEPRYTLANGQGAAFSTPEPLAAESWLTLAELDGDRREARIFLAAPITLTEIETHFADEIETATVCAWDSREQVVQARRQKRLGRLILEDKPWPQADPADLAAAMAEGVREMGLACLPWTSELEGMRRRLAFLATHAPEAGWPDLSDAALLEGLEVWLAPFLPGLIRRSHLTRLDLGAALAALIPYDRRRQLDALAPTHVTVPSGSRLPIDYSSETPVLAVRLQEMFGCADTPRIADGQVKLLLHLLSPARRPVQVTQDLASFWAGAYRQVRADLKGQYPKHWWPDDPMQAEPTARTKPRRA